MNPHEEIIRRGFREVSARTGFKGQGRRIKYTRDNETILHQDYGEGQNQRHVLQYFRDERKISGGTAWYAILLRHVDA